MDYEENEIAEEETISNGQEKGSIRLPVTYGEIPCTGSRQGEFLSVEGKMRWIERLQGLNLNFRGQTRGHRNNIPIGNNTRGIS
jgi:hypothetical protein